MVYGLYLGEREGENHQVGIEVIVTVPHSAPSIWRDDKIPTRCTQGRANQRLKFKDKLKDNCHTPGLYTLLEDYRISAPNAMNCIFARPLSVLCLFWAGGGHQDPMKDHSVATNKFRLSDPQSFFLEKPPETRSGKRLGFEQKDG